MAASAGLFPNAKNFDIHDSNFADYSNANVTNSNHYYGQSTNDNDGLALLYPFIATGATHDAAERGDPPKCHENTRVALLKRIASFFHDRTPDLTARLLCVIAPAGGGKTALLQTSSERGKKEGTLAASFFFWSTANQRNNKDRLVITIAYQLAISIPFLRPYIIAAFQRDESIPGKNVESQMHVLLVEPTRLALQAPNCKPHTWPRGISIDGLDECKGDINQADILRSLSKTLLNPHNRFPFSILLASRPEVAIRNALDSILKNDRVLRLDLDHSHRPDLDIRVFMQCEFDAIKKRDPGLRESSASWPTQQAYDTLVENASGQFIYPSVVIKFVGETGGNPDKRLQMVLQVKALTTQSKNPLAILDGLYTSIITRAQSQLEERSEEPVVDPLQTVRMLRYISSVEVLDFPMALSVGNPPAAPVSQRRRDLRFVALMYLTVEEELLDKKRVQLLDTLLQLAPGTVERSLVDVHSLVDVSTLRFYHRSFLDFLDDARRCGNLHVPASSIHEYITSSCLVHLAALDDEEICAVAAKVFKTLYEKIPEQESYLIPLVRFLKGYELRRQHLGNDGPNWLNHDFAEVATAFAKEVMNDDSDSDRRSSFASSRIIFPEPYPYPIHAFPDHEARPIQIPQYPSPPSPYYSTPLYGAQAVAVPSRVPSVIPIIPLPRPHPPSNLFMSSSHLHVPSRERSSHSHTQSNTVPRSSDAPSAWLVQVPSESTPLMWRSIKLKFLTFASEVATANSHAQEYPVVRALQKLKAREKFLSEAQKRRGFWAKIGAPFRRKPVPPPRGWRRSRRASSPSRVLVDPPPPMLAVEPQAPKKQRFWPKVITLFKRSGDKSSGRSDPEDFDTIFNHVEEASKGTWHPVDYGEWKYVNAKIPDTILVDLFRDVKSVKEMGRSLENLPKQQKKFILQTLQSLLELPELLELSGERTVRKTLLHFLSVTGRHWAAEVPLDKVKFDDAPIRDQSGRGFKATVNQQLLDLCIPTREGDRNLALIWEHLEHENIYPFYGLFQGLSGSIRNRTCYVWPWIPGCTSLKDYIKHLPSAKQFLLLHDVLCGLEYLHNLDIVVSTLTASTIVVTESGRACIKNFGPNFPTRIRSKVKDTVKHDYYLQAPEIFSGRDYAFVDKKEYVVYSFGCICFEILSGYIPIQPRPVGKASEIAYLKFKNEEPHKIQAEGWNELWPLIEECLGWNQASEPARPSVSELLSKPVFANLATPHGRPKNEWEKIVTPSPAAFRAAIRLVHNYPHLQAPYSLRSPWSSAPSSQTSISSRRRSRSSSRSRSIIRRRRGRRRISPRSRSRRRSLSSSSSRSRSRSPIHPPMPMIIATPVVPGSPSDTSSGSFLDALEEPLSTPF